MENKTERFFKRVHKERLTGPAPPTSQKEPRMSFAEHVRWEILKRYLPSGESLKLLEVGSAPGNNLVRIAKVFGYAPYGVDNSESGIEMNRENFRKNNIDENNVIYSDFFDDDFQRRFKGFFDVCLSDGFLEHFDDNAAAVESHLNILKKGGYLAIIIPNFRYLNYFFLKLFSPHLVDIHNLKIMNLNSFSGLFDKPVLQTLFCGYQGGFNFGLFYAERKTTRRRVLKFCKKWLQPGLNALFYALASRRLNTECKYSSPYLIYIGRKA